MSEQRFGALADRMARRYGVPPALFRALIRQESGWRPSAVSPAGARGLTQVVPRWHPNANLSTPKGQLEYGAKHLGSLLKKYGNPEDALSVYNSGRPWSQGRNIRETSRYVPAVLSMYRAAGPAAPQSGGRVPADAGGVPPALPASPVPQPQLNMRALMKLMGGVRESVLAGKGLPKNYESQMMRMIESAKPREVAAGTAARAATTAVGTPADPSSAQVVNAARRHLGTPYSWGGGTPSGPSRGFGRGANTIGFDCSSLVQNAWAKVGVSLPRTTYEQIKVGRAINTSNRASWKPGDLLFPSTGHVQMYIGNGKVIEAPRTGGRVQIVPARSRYIAVRRPG